MYRLYTVSGRDPRWSSNATISTVYRGDNSAVRYGVLYQCRAAAAAFPFPDDQKRVVGVASHSPLKVGRCEHLLQEHNVEVLLEDGLHHLMFLGSEVLHVPL